MKAIHIGNKTLGRMHGSKNEQNHMYIFTTYPLNSWYSFLKLYLKVLNASLDRISKGIK